MQQLRFDEVEGDVDLTHPDGIATVVWVELRSESASCRAHFFDRCAVAQSQHCIRVRVHAVDGYVVDRSSAYRARTPASSPLGAANGVPTPRPHCFATC